MRVPIPTFLHGLPIPVPNDDENEPEIRLIPFDRRSESPIPITVFHGRESFSPGSPTPAVIDLSSRKRSASPERPYPRKRSATVQVGQRLEVQERQEDNSRLYFLVRSGNEWSVFRSLNDVGRRILEGGIFVEQLSEEKIKQKLFESCLSSSFTSQ
jgi:hypothetical protein